MAERIEAVVTMKGIYSYERAAYTYGTETAYIYNMEAEDGTVYVWKTTAFMTEKVRVADDANSGYSEIDAKGRKWTYEKINKGDVIRIKATVKGQGEYKGQPQTELTRVKVVERTFKAETWEEIQAKREAEKAAKAKEQRDSLNGEDFIWTMTYKQYKEHYSDCETVVGSFNNHEKENARRQRHFFPATISVIIREGRLKASGVRGEHYSGYRLQNAEGEQVVYRAVKEENAIRRAEKEFGGSWKCIKIYEYERTEW